MHLASECPKPAYQVYPQLCPDLSRRVAAAAACHLEHAWTAICYHVCHRCMCSLQPCARPTQQQQQQLWQQAVRQ